MKIAAKLAQTLNDLSTMEKRYHRKQGSVCLLAVSKTRSIEEITTAIEAGQRHFGENYCQEAIDKIESINSPELIWHFIGPIQSNKTRQIAQYFDWVHTVDRIKVARRLDEMRPVGKKPLNICIQINISGEKSKSGISMDELPGFINELEQFNKIKLRGLMTLPAPSNDFNEQRKPFFRLNQKLLELSKTRPDIDTLSMGTSQDMEAAIAEGATIVRIGTTIFGPRNAPKQTN